MDFTDVIKNRRSHRKFKEDIVDDEILKRIIEAGRLAPTWSNMQGPRYIIVKNKTIIKEIADGNGQKWIEKVPMLIVVCIAPKGSGKNANGLEYFPVDAAICMEHIVLAATNEGLGTCWIGLFDENKIKDALSIPEKVRVIALTPLGYSRYTPREQIRKPIEQICFSEKWGTNIKF